MQENIGQIEQKNISKISTVSLRRKGWGLNIKKAAVALKSRQGPEATIIPISKGPFTNLIFVKPDIF